MKTRIFSIIAACFIITSVVSQTNVNNYKYIIVPSKFEFLKQKDQYQLNSLTQFLFNKYGFEAVMEGSDYPNELSRNRCLGLRSNVINDSGMFKTKLTIELKDCNDKVVYTSKAGESREKEYNKAYMGALRSAFKSIEALDYKYQPNDNIVGLQTNGGGTKGEVNEEIEQLKQEIQNLKKEKEVDVTANAMEVSAPPVPVKPIESHVANKAESDVDLSSNVLYAQEIKDGFQLVDSTPKVVYKIKKTGFENVFLVERRSAIIYKKEGHNWVIEYYSNNVLKQEKLNIKF